MRHLNFVAVLCLVLLVGQVVSVHAAQDEQYRQDALISPIQQAIADVAENARTDLAPEDMVMGGIMGVAATLRYPLNMADTLGKALDSVITTHTERKNRDMALQAARVILGESIQSVDATRRSALAIQEEQTRHQPDHRKAALLLQTLVSQITATKDLLTAMNARCKDTDFGKTKVNGSLRFIHEDRTKAVQREKDAILSSLSTDWEQQTFLGGLVYQAVDGLRYPIMDAVRIGFFLERLHAANTMSSERGVALLISQAVLERDVLSVRQAIWYLESIGRANPGDERIQRIIYRSVDCHRQVLDILNTMRNTIANTSL